MAQPRQSGIGFREALRGRKGLLGTLEQWLYRAYCRLPGLSTDRKRRLVVWLHRRLPMVTRGTYSFQLYHLHRQFYSHDPVVASLPPGPRMDAERAAAVVERMQERVEFRIVILVWSAADREALAATLSSLQGQFYPRWQAEAILVGQPGDDDPRPHGHAVGLSRQPSAEAAAEHLRGRLAAAPRALVTVLQAGDQLTRDALLEVAGHAAGATMVYADCEITSPGDGRRWPQFKPGFSDDLLLSTNFVGQPFFFWSCAPSVAAGLPTLREGEWEHDLLLRLAEEHGARPVQVSEVLLSRGGNRPPSAGESRHAVAAVAAALSRRQLAATAEPGRAPGTCRVRRRLAGQPLVSIAIAFRDRPELLSRCVESVLERSTYQNLEILAVDNGSVEPGTRDLLSRLAAQDNRIRVTRRDEPFNYAALNNHAAGMASGEHLVFLNNDTRVIAPGWIEAMLEHSQRPDVGVVGALLLFADGTVQHAGLVIGVGGVCEHAFVGEPGGSPGHMSLPQVVREVSAVTFACAMTRREVYAQLSGLNADELRVAFNDVDYCLRAREQGLRVVYTPYAELYHDQSRSRGGDDSRDKQLRALAEMRYMQRRHERALRAVDPFYSPAFSRWDPPFFVRMDYVTRMPTNP